MRPADSNTPTHSNFHLLALAFTASSTSSMLAIAFVHASHPLHPPTRQAHNRPPTRQAHNRPLRFSSPLRQFRSSIISTNSTSFQLITATAALAGISKRKQQPSSILSSSHKMAADVQPYSDILPASCLPSSATISTSNFN